ncbi:hypothetical protein N7509_003558 [Penicillium cosmopolitanum]|uniref:C2H2-type domain-containing protein n=1 Tax=Penicillium cosmopolitanum TaxID=1131564 RepID=A0A9W9W5D6_9EURO|nr:uncharacterized protein N7509_003558 [Penicillium cosmopolitanum]KAJ5403687.1 hypothetical protein N7509_003558 [Penicillium cosmopolitanum]
MTDLYDSDDAMNRSPPPVAVCPKYEPDDARPPFVPPSDDVTEKGDKGTPERSRKPHQPETQTHTRFGDSVLINFLAPGRPDIAAYERDNSLTDCFRKNRSPVDKKPLDGPGGLVSKPIEPPKPTTAEPVSLKEEEPLEKSLGDQPRKDHERPLSPPNKLPTPLPRLAPSVDTPRSLDFPSPAQRPHRLSVSTLTHPERKLSLDHHPLSDIKQSPELKNRFSLPSLQSLSPPSSCAATSPENGGTNNSSGNPNTQVLPSIQSALSGLSSSDFPPARLNAISPYSYPPSSSSQNDSPHDRQLTRQFFPPSQMPTPYSHFSPVSAKDASNNPSPATSSYWRPPLPAPPPPPPPPPPSQPAETPHHAPTPYDMSPMTAKSPATSYPTPTEQIAPTPPAGERAAFNAAPQPPNGLTVPGSYKCTHPGCTAAPFQTQYLLNSHANVHSQDRPHFCPVDGCPRGLGGKGFKRKNEMMRHGLVHNSPGYVCPFCPDQQHKYPRPDNLQRQVALPTDMSVFTTSIKIKTTLSSGKSSHSAR